MDDLPQIPVNNCCGCTACASICPTKAIHMRPNQEGFLYPEIDIDRCCNCNKCEKACPIINPPELPDAFEGCAVAQSCDNQVLNESTSGGFVDTLCKYVLDDIGGYVCGVEFDSEFMPRHRIVHTYEEAKAFRNSKYAQSNLDGVFSDILRLLREEKTVMFIGTPCQVAGLKTYLGIDYDNLITVDLVCRSIPSPKLWRMYLEWQKKRYGSDIKKVVCRKKTYGYHSGALEIDFENGKHYAGSNRVDYYMKSFHKDICSRLSCYDCQFKTKHRCSDFTVFDSWRPDTVVKRPFVDNDRGYSNILVHTVKGKGIMYHLNGIDLNITDTERLLSVMGSMIAASVKYPKERDTFYKELEVVGFYKTVKRYVCVSVKDRVIEWAKPIRYVFKQRKIVRYSKE